MKRGSFDEFKRIQDFCDANIIFLQKVSDERQLSLWYEGEVFEIHYGVYTAYVSISGKIKLRKTGEKKCIYDGTGGTLFQDYIAQSRYLPNTDRQVISLIKQGEISVVPNRIYVCVDARNRHYTDQVLKTKNLYIAVNNVLNLLATMGKY